MGVSTNASTKCQRIFVYYVRKLIEEPTTQNNNLLWYKNIEEVILNQDRKDC